MKVLTLTQPWATLVAIQAKRIETRSWQTNYRGPVAIHAAKGFPKWARETCSEEPFKSALLGSELPRGCVLAIGTLVECYSVDAISFRQQCCGLELTVKERAFGDFSKGRYCWELRDVVLLEEPKLSKDSFKFD